MKEFKEGDVVFHKSLGWRTIVNHTTFDGKNFFDKDHTFHTCADFEHYKPETIPANEFFCDHSWVDVGFRFTKFVCKKCDTERKEDA